VVIDDAAICAEQVKGSAADKISARNGKEKDAREWWLLRPHARRPPARFIDSAGAAAARLGHSLPVLTC